jgi:small subunit ribosomal protein S20
MDGSCYDLGFVAGRNEPVGLCICLEGISVANHASALKAHRQNVVHRERNRRYRSQLRSALKNMRAGLSGGDAATVKSALGETVSLIDRMVTKGVIHKNAASRYKSRLVKRASAPTAAA